MQFSPAAANMQKPPGVEGVELFHGSYAITDNSGVTLIDLAV